MLQASGLLLEGDVTRLVARKCKGDFARRSHPDKQCNAVSAEYNDWFSEALQTLNALIEVLGEEESNFGQRGLLRLVCPATSIHWA